MKIKEAFVAGRESGQAEASVLFEAEKIRLEREFQDQLAAAEVLFMQQTGHAHGGADQRGPCRNFSGSFGVRSLPFSRLLVEENLRERTVEGFVDEVERMTKGLEGLAGNLPVRPIFSTCFACDRRSIRCVAPSRKPGQSELSLKLDDAVVETRLGRLIDALRDPNQ